MGKHKKCKVLYSQLSAKALHNSFICQSVLTDHSYVNSTHKAEPQEMYIPHVKVPMYLNWGAWSNDLMHSNKDHSAILLRMIHFQSTYPMIVHTPTISDNLPIKSLVAR